jgi:hypothetical protein
MPKPQPQRPSTTPTGANRADGKIEMISADGTEFLADDQAEVQKFLSETPPSRLKYPEEATVSGVQFGTPPKNQLTRTPFGRVSPLSSELTNPISLSKGLLANRPPMWDAPKPPTSTPKTGPPPSSAIIPPKMRVPAREKDFNTRLESLKAQFKQETGGYELRVVRGGNVTEVEQYKKYLQGRPELPGGTKGPIVTPLSGKPGEESTHQFGEGADVIFIKDGKQADYIDRTKSHQPPNKLGERLYAILGRIAEQKGLEWGGRWKGNENDPPHVQLPQPKKDTANTESRNIGKKGNK